MFRYILAIYITCVYSSLTNKLFLIYYCTRSAECCANGICVRMDKLAIPAGAVACRRPANNTLGVRRSADEISHLSAIAQMAARVVAQVEFSPSVVYGNACSNPNYSNVITASPVRLSFLLE